MVVTTNNVIEQSGDEAAQRRRLRFVLLTLAFVVTWMFINSFFATGWVTAFMLAYLVLAIDVIYIIKTDDSLLGTFLFFGLVAGFTELLADAWLVEKTKTLYYEASEPLLLDSPVYMPIAWTVVLVQIGYLGYWIYLKKGLLVASLVCGLIGGTVIPLYESFAKGAGWWQYEDPTRIIWNTPYYIIIGEFLLALALPALLLWCSKKEFYWTIPIGIIMGLWIWVAYFIGYSLVG
jgi:hypothetical protein